MWMLSELVTEFWAEAVPPDYWHRDPTMPCTPSINILAIAVLQCYYSQHDVIWFREKMSKEQDDDSSYASQSAMKAKRKISRKITKKTCKEQDVDSSYASPAGEAKRKRRKTGDEVFVKELQLSCICLPENLMDKWG
jgi:hypothetical protein